MSYCIGLDCGITSVGFAVIELDSNEEPSRVVKLGSRIFSAAENPKTGASLAAPRREARGTRRRLRRHRHRNERIRIAIIDNNILSDEEMKILFDNTQTDIYELRAKALDQKLSRGEFARVLIHIAQRRGFKSNRKVDAQDKENGKILAAVSENAAIMKENGYRTVGEMIYRDMKFALYKRNKADSYSNTFSRAMIEDEIHKLFSAQRERGNHYATESFERCYAEIVLSQRSFEDGPGGESKYGGNQIDKMVGKCTLIPDEKRAFKASYSFQVFSLWQNINNIIIIKNGDTRTLTDAQRMQIFNAAHKTASLNYSGIRKVLSLGNDEFFYGLSYKGSVEDAEKVKFEFLKPYHEIRKALDKVSKGRINYISVDQLNEIGRIFSVFKNDLVIESSLETAGLERCDIEQLLTLH